MTNMNHFEQQLKKEAEALRLTSAEKAAMRLRLKEAMSTAGAPTASPYFFYSFQFVRTARYAFAALLMVVFVGGGTVSAAAGALPGDWLYAVKTGVNERVELALADTAQEELRVEAQFAERRVSEAEALEAEGRLDAEVAEEIELRFDEHASRALALAESMRPSVSAELRATDDASLKQGPPEEEEDAQPMAFMAMTAEQAEMGTVTAPTSSKFEASVELEILEVEEEVDAVLQRQRDRLERLKERLDARLDESFKKGIEAELDTTTSVEIPVLELEAEATSTAEVSESTPALPESEQEAVEEKITGEEEVFKADQTRLERIIEKTLPIRPILGL